MSTYFTLKGFVGLHSQPLALFWALLLFAAALRLLGWKRPAWTAVALGITIVGLCSLPTLARAFARPLEQMHPVIAADAPAPAAVVVLGSGVAHPGDENLPALTRLGVSARARLIEGVRLSLRYPEARLITSGYGLRFESCADAMAEAAEELGVARERITRLTTARDTADEADLTLRAVGKGARVVVVTSAVHMPRAMLLFRRRGLDVTAAPCDFICPVSDDVRAQIDPIAWWPMAVALEAQERIWHEALGLVYIKYLGGE